MFIYKDFLINSVSALPKNNLLHEVTSFKTLFLRLNYKYSKYKTLSTNNDY
jgi:hypothetical protein